MDKKRRVYVFYLGLLGIVCVFILVYKIHKISILKKSQSGAHPPFFEYKIDKPDSISKLFLLLTPYQLSRWHDGQLVIMDKTGKVYLQKNIKGAPFCFRGWNINGHRRYSYIIDDSKVYHIPHIGMAAGKVIITDSALNILQTLTLLPHGDITTNRNEGLDLHDFILLSDSHYIAIAVCERRVNNIPAKLNPVKDIIVDAPIIQEVENGSVIWQWDATEHPELYYSSEEGNNYTDTATKHDYLHINSIVIDPKDSNLICSFRNSSQIIKINRKSGAILWKLGGKNSDFSLEPDEFFLKQHSAALADDNQTLLVFDNGDTSKRRYSRVVEFKLDEKKRTVIDFSSFNIPEPFSLFMGAAEKHGDNYFISGGTGNYLLEVNRKTNTKIFEMHCNLALYRAYQEQEINGVKYSTDQLSIIKDVERVK